MFRYILMAVCCWVLQCNRSFAQNDGEQLNAPEQPTDQIEIVLDTDAFNEVDDQFALAFAARVPDRVRLLAVTAAPFRNHRSTSFADGMQKSYHEIIRILKLLDLSAKLAAKGSEAKLTDRTKPIESEAARTIIRLAHQRRRQPLYVVGLGAATNIASAILLDPTIAKRIVVVWIGGHPYHYDNALDFNLKQNIVAAQVLFESNVPLVHIPAGDVAEQLSITLPELAKGIRGQSVLCDELYERVASYRTEVTKGSAGDANERSWKKIIWDIATIAWLIDAQQCVQTEVRPRPQLRGDGTWAAADDNSSSTVRVAVDLDRTKVFQHLFDALANDRP